MHALFLNTFKKLCLIAFPIALILFFISPYLFTFVFGQEWAISGKITQYLVFIFFITFTVSSVSPVLSIGEYVRRGAVWKYMYFTTSLFLFWISYFFEVSFLEFLFLFVLHEYILYSIYLYLIFISVNQIDKSQKVI